MQESRRESHGVGMLDMLCDIIRFKINENFRKMILSKVCLKKAFAYISLAC